MTTSLNDAELCMMRDENERLWRVIDAADAVRLLDCLHGYCDRCHEREKAQEQYNFAKARLTAGALMKPTEKISDLPHVPICRNPEHLAPTMMLWEPGVYRHTCPGCGAAYTFVVGPRPEM